MMIIIINGERLWLLITQIIIQNNNSIKKILLNVLKSRLPSYPSFVNFLQGKATL